MNYLSLIAGSVVGTTLGALAAYTLHLHRRVRTLEQQQATVSQLWQQQDAINRLVGNAMVHQQAWLRRLTEELVRLDGRVGVVEQRWRADWDQGEKWRLGKGDDED